MSQIKSSCRTRQNNKNRSTLTHSPMDVETHELDQAAKQKESSEFFRAAPEQHDPANLGYHPERQAVLTSNKICSRGHCEELGALPLLRTPAHGASGALQAHHIPFSCPTFSDSSSLVLQPTATHGGGDPPASASAHWIRPSSPPPSPPPQHARSPPPPPYNDPFHADWPHW
jgi:hypothetical protein